MVGPAVLFASLCLGVKLRTPMPAPALASRRPVIAAALALATAPWTPISRARALEDLDGAPPERLDETCAPIQTGARVGEHTRAARAYRVVPRARLGPTCGDGASAH